MDNLPSKQMSIRSVLAELREQPSSKNEHWEACHVAADKIDLMRRMLLRAVSPHAFNCGWRKHPTQIRLIQVSEGCTCGVDELLAAFSSDKEPRP